MNERRKSGGSRLLHACRRSATYRVPDGMADPRQRLGRQVSPFDQDAKAGARIAEYTGDSVYSSRLVAEGSRIHCIRQQDPLGATRAWQA